MATQYWNTAYQEEEGEAEFQPAGTISDNPRYGPAPALPPRDDFSLEPEEPKIARYHGNAPDDSSPSSSMSRSLLTSSDRPWYQLTGRCQAGLLVILVTLFVMAIAMLAYSVHVRSQGRQQGEQGKGETQWLHHGEDGNYRTAWNLADSGDDEERGCENQQLYVSNSAEPAPSHVISPQGVVDTVHFTSQEMYVTSAGQGSIFYTDVDNAVWTVDVATTESLPEQITVLRFKALALAADTKTRKLFVSLLNQGVKAMNYDGSQQENVVSEEHGGSNGMQVDEENKILYWTDAYLDTVEKVEYAYGRYRREVMVNLGERLHPRGLALDIPGATLYYILLTGEIHSVKLAPPYYRDVTVTAPTASVNAFALVKCGANFYYTDTSAEAVWRVKRSQAGDDRQKFNKQAIGADARAMVHILSD